MTKATQSHLKNITFDSFLDWTHETFIPYMTLQGASGTVELGVTGKGKYAVRKGESIDTYETPGYALEVFRKRLSE